MIEGFRQLIQWFLNFIHFQSPAIQCVFFQDILVGVYCLFRQTLIPYNHSFFLKPMTLDAHLLSSCDDAVYATATY